LVDKPLVIYNEGLEQASHDLVFGVHSGFIGACKITSLCVQQLQFLPP